MIVDAILGAFVNVLRGFFDLVPAWSPDLGSLNTTFYTIGHSASVLNGYFPVAAIAVGLGLVFAARLFWFAWIVVVWIYDKIPMKAT